MRAFICCTCGTQYAPSGAPPQSCAICEDERQYVPASGQAWTTLEDVARKHANQFRAHEPGLTGLAAVPPFAIGQRALLVRTPQGNVLWDCVATLDAAAIEIVKAMGGLCAIAISHPHYYTTMVEWSRAFGDAPIHLHRADSKWIMRPDPRIALWDGDTKTIAEGLTLIRLGGHFAGGTVAHWAQGAGGRGALLAGDVVMPVNDGKHVSFMRSYPNLIPLPAEAVRRIVRLLAPFAFETVYGPFFDRLVRTGGDEAVRRSAARYVAALEQGFAD